MDANKNKFSVPIRPAGHPKHCIILSAAF